MLFAFVGCASVESEETSRRADGLVGGAVDDGGYPEVVMLRAVFTNDAGVSQGFACTGTVITPRVVLAAAHCFNENGGPPGTRLTGVFVHNFDVAPPTNSALWVAATTWRKHPSWTASAPMNNDLGLLQMAAPIAGVTPHPYLNRPLVSADVSRPMEVVGYGITSSGGSGAGTRRFVSLPLRGLTSAHLQLGNMSTAGICNGDSGGPSFITERDGIRRVAGVHSYTQPTGNCMDGLDTRVDLYGPFIRQFLMDTGGASCVEDGLCATGCATPDPDCVCQADGTCNGQCPNLASDPDCPIDCAANNVCTNLSCPRADPDCITEGSTCTMDAQCQYRVCASDPQRPNRYCSRPCTASCPMGTSCVGTVCLAPQLPTATEGQACTTAGTFCVGTICSGPIGGALTCHRSCTTNSNCASTDECITGQNGARICERKPPEAMPGEACVLGLTRCLGNTTCTGLLGGPTSCRVTCQSNATCNASDECVDGANSVKFCSPRVPPVMAGEPCVPGVSRCVTPLGCTGLAGEATTCRALCTMDGQCSATDECAPAQGQVKLCAPKPPEAMPGEACTIGVTRCLQQTTCTGVPGDAPTCQLACEFESDCAATDYCARGLNDAGVCRPQPFFLEAIKVAESPQPKVGCQAITGWGLVSGALLLTRRRRREGR